MYSSFIKIVRLITVASFLLSPLTAVATEGWSGSSTSTWGAADTLAPSAVSDLHTMGEDTQYPGYYNFGWTEASDTGGSSSQASYIELRYSTQSASQVTDANWNSLSLLNGQPAMAPGTQRSISIGLSPGTYYVGLRTRDAAYNWSPVSNIATLTAAPKDTTPPGAISSVSVVGKDSTTVTLTWTAPAEDGYSGGTIYAYVVRHSTSILTESNFSSGIYSATTTPLAPGSAQSVDISGLTQGTTYYFAIQSYDDSGNVSPISTVVNFTMPAAAASDTTPPAQITYLSVGYKSSSSVQLTWTAPADDGTSGSPVSYYEIRYGTALTSATFTSGSSAPSPTPLAPGSVQTSDVTSLTPGTTYYFGVRACDEAPNCGPVSSIVPYTMPLSGGGQTTTSTPSGPDTTPPAAINDLHIMSTGSSYVSVMWYAAGDDGWSGQAAFYELRYSTSMITEANWASASLGSSGVAPTANSSPEYTVNSLQPNTSYYFAVKTRDEASNWSSISTVTQATTYQSGTGTTTSTPGGGTTLPTGTAGITGKITDYNGVPVAGAYVGLSNFGNSGYTSVQTDANGNYTLSGYAGGSYRFGVGAPSSRSDLGYISDETVNLVAGTTITKNASLPKYTGPTPVSPPVPVSFYLDNGASYPNNGAYNVPTGVTIKVRFNAPIDKSGVTPGNIILESYEKSDVAVAGTFSAQEYGFDFTPSSFLLPNKGYQMRIKGTFKSASGAIFSGSFLLGFSTGSTGGGANLGTIKGKVTDSQGLVVSGAFVDTRASNGTRMGASTNANGEYEISQLLADTYSLELFSPPGRPDLQSPSPTKVSLKGGETLTQNFSFTKQSGVKQLVVEVTRDDGKSVAGTHVGAYQKYGGQWRDVVVDATGSVTLALSGGVWNVNIWPDPGADWNNTEPPREVKFREDNTEEVAKVDFRIRTVESGIKGKILEANGQPPAVNTVGVHVSGSGIDTGNYVGADGSFTVRVPAGTYRLAVYRSGRGLEKELPAITVPAQTITDIGKIVLEGSAARERIVGRVIDEKEAVVPGVRVFAWQASGGYVETKTSANGEYTLEVSVGRWLVYVEPPDNFTNPTPPKEIDVLSGVTATLNFTLASASATISGVVQDEKGVVLSDLPAFAFLRLPSGIALKAGSPVERGGFVIRTKPGTYIVDIDLSPSSGYAKGEPVKVTVGSGQTATVKIVVKTNTAKLTGALRDKSGKVITGVAAHVIAATGKTGAAESDVDTLTGRYTLTLSPGSWFVNVVVDPNAPYVSAPVSGDPVVLKAGELKTFDFQLVRNDGVVFGTTVDSAGKPVPFAWVSIDNFSSGSAATPVAPMHASVAGGKSDEQGRFNFSVPAGTYYVHGYLSSEKSLLNPEETKVQVKAGDEVEVKLVFRSRNQTAKGTVTFNGQGVPAVVWGWSERGGYAETTADVDGAYSLSIYRGETWHIFAGFGEGDKYYKSDEITVRSDEDVVTRSLALSPYIIDLPEPVVVTTAVTSPQAINLDNGTVVSLPANSIPGTGDVTVNVTPDTTVTSQSTAALIGIGYEVAIRDASGKEVTKLNSPMTITLPYDAAAVTAAGLNPEELVPAYWDETAGTWKKIDSYVIDTKSNKIVCTVSHLTTFAIISGGKAKAAIAPETGEGTMATPAEESSIKISLPKTVTIPVGKAVKFSYTVTNEEEETMKARLVRELVDPTGKVVTRSRTIVTLKSGASRTFKVNQVVPRKGKPGVYTVTIQLQDVKTGEVLDENRFELYAAKPTAFKEHLRYFALR